MTFYEKVQALCAEKGVSVTKLATSLGFSSSTPNNWQKMNGLPRSSTVKAVADYFGVSVDYLTSNDESVQIKNVQDNHGIIGHTHAPVTINNGSDRKLSEQEIELLDIFNSLSILDRAKLIVYASELKAKAK